MESEENNNVETNVEKVEEENAQVENQEEVKNEENNNVEEKANEEEQAKEEQQANEVKEEEQAKEEQQVNEVKEEEQAKEEQQANEVKEEEVKPEEEQQANEVKEEEQAKEEQQANEVKEEEVKPEEEQPKQESYPEEKLEIEEVKEAPKEEQKEFEPKKETSEIFLDYGLKVKAQWYCDEKNKNNESDSIDIVFSTESKNKLVLHWGVFKDNQNDKCWYHPDESCYPPLTKEFDNYALETDFSYLEGDEKEQKIHMRFPKGNGSPKNDLDSLNFVFFEKDNNKWHNNNWQDYHIKLN